MPNDRASAIRLTGLTPDRNKLCRRRSSLVIAWNVALVRGRLFRIWFAFVSFASSLSFESDIQSALRCAVQCVCVYVLAAALSHSTIRLFAGVRLSARRLSSQFECSSAARSLCPMFAGDRCRAWHFVVVCRCSRVTSSTIHRSASHHQ